MANGDSLSKALSATIILVSCFCQAPAARVPADAPAQSIDRSAPSLRELRNATYRGAGEAGAGAFALAEGRWEGQPVAPGAASRPSVTFVRDFRLAGDLDGDGAEEAVVLLAASAGGTGEMSYLAIAGRRGGKVVNLTTARVGDRVQVRAARIVGKLVVLDIVQAGKSDAACCPGDLVTRSWRLVAGGLREGAPVATGRFSLDILTGTDWVLRSWSWNEDVPETPRITLKFDGTRVAGTAGCNNYFAAAKPGSTPEAITIGPAGATRMMCPEPAMAAEARFLRQLGGVSQLRFVAGQLALQYANPDHTFGVMLFDRRAAK